MEALLKELKAEASYFTIVDGLRGVYVVVNMDDASQMPALAEPVFLWLKGKVEFIPVMLLQDLAKAGPAIASAAIIPLADACINPRVMPAPSPMANRFSTWVSRSDDNSIRLE